MVNFQENFLHLVWKYQYFDRNQLSTTSEIPILVKKIGFHNFHEGPDFNEAQIKLGELDHFGHVEIHLKSSDWNAHSHGTDERYDAVILHVVWEHDVEILRKDGTPVPTLELRGKIYLDVLRNYERLITGKPDILCSQDLDQVKEIIKFSMLEKSLVERFFEKSHLVNEILESTFNDWEETTYRWLFFCFGFKVNNQTMLKLARMLPYRLLKKHAGNRAVQEALLLGQAGFLRGEARDAYSLYLQKEFHFYQNKYGLGESIFPSEWKFMRVRPANYPSVRLAQIAAILHSSPNLCSAILQEDASIRSIQDLFNTQTSDYWQLHYYPGKKTNKKHLRHITKEILHLLAINFLVPLWYAYGQFTDNGLWQEKCFDLLQETPPENNRIIQKFKAHQWNPQNAFDTQGMIGLYNNYCLNKKCLECKIGQALLRPLSV
ncbi:MAG TPA: DUF2851 family protein [Cyclobacteriaceae bacterium]|nr:DUF2851 family protein [Cyclobacteriaceae bacterium]